VPSFWRRCLDAAVFDQRAGSARTSPKELPRRDGPSASTASQRRRVEAVRGTGLEPLAQVARRVLVVGERTVMGTSPKARTTWRQNWLCRGRSRALGVTATVKVLARQGELFGANRVHVGFSRTAEAAAMLQRLDGRDGRTAWNGREPGT